MARPGGWTWLRTMAVISGVAFFVSLFLPPSVLPPDRLPFVASGFTTLIGLAAGAEVKQRTKGNGDGPGKG